MLHLTVSKFNKPWGLCHRSFSRNFFKNFQNSYVKKQSHFHAVGTVQEADGLLEDLISSALNLVIHKKRFRSFLGVQFGLLKKPPKMYYLYLPLNVFD